MRTPPRARHSLTVHLRLPITFRLLVFGTIRETSIRLHLMPFSSRDRNDSSSITNLLRLLLQRPVSFEKSPALPHKVEAADGSRDL